MRKMITGNNIRGKHLIIALVVASCTADTALRGRLPGPSLRYTNGTSVSTGNPDESVFWIGRRMYFVERGFGDPPEPSRFRVAELEANGDFKDLGTLKLSDGATDADPDMLYPTCHKPGIPEYFTGFSLSGKEFFVAGSSGGTCIVEINEDGTRLTSGAILDDYTSADAISVRTAGFDIGEISFFNFQYVDTVPGRYELQRRQAEYSGGSVGSFSSPEVVAEFPESAINSIILDPSSLVILNPAAAPAQMRLLAITEDYVMNRQGFEELRSRLVGLNAATKRKTLLFDFGGAAIDSIAAGPDDRLYLSIYNGDQAVSNDLYRFIAPSVTVFNRMME